METCYVTTVRGWINPGFNFWEMLEQHITQAGCLSAWYEGWQPEGTIWH